MKLEELNVFKFLNKRKIPTNKKLKYTIKNHTARFEAKGYKQCLISHKLRSEGGGYEVRLSGKSHNINKHFEDNQFEEAIKLLIQTSNDWIDKAKGGKIETSPADLLRLNTDHFNITTLKKELAY